MVSFFYFSHFCLQTLARNLKSSMLSVAIVPLAEAVTVSHIITQPTIGKWSIVMSVSVCLLKVFQFSSVYVGYCERALTVAYIDQSINQSQKIYTVSRAANPRPIQLSRQEMTGPNCRW